jgi:hypothetical protein
MKQPRKMIWCKWSRLFGAAGVRGRATAAPLLLALAGVLVLALPAHASVTLLMEEPYGTFGAFNPTGHAAVYLNHVCADTSTQLRPCAPGEFGVVISRYHKIDGYDWIAIPLIPYLYAVDNAADVPPTVDRQQVAQLRDAYRRAHLEALAPDTASGLAPGGEWTQLVGSSYDRTIHGFEIDSTPEQDAHFIAYFNDRRNVGHFNLFFHNCADFSRNVLGMYLPGAVHRNFIADVGLTTPKQVARSLLKYGDEHPELGMFAFIIRQVPGSVPRSHAVHGVAESLVKSKKYLIPMAVLQPELTAGVIVAYLATGRLSLPKDATVYDAEDFAAGTLQPGVAFDPADAPDDAGHQGNAGVEGSAASEAGGTSTPEGGGGGVRTLHGAAALQH